jgi:HEPN domain-containing protein
MAPDAARVADVRAWLSKAALDLRAATHEISAPAEALWGDVMFHAQQAAEKGMKAFLVSRDVPFRKTHNLEELGQRCAELDLTLVAFVDETVPLTDYAWRFRYPGETHEPSHEEAEEALETARRFYDAILSRVPPDARP